MRPVTINPAPTYTIPVEMQCNQQAVKAGLAANNVQPVRGVSIFNTQQVLNVLQALTFQNRGRDDWGNLNAVNQALVAALRTYFGSKGLVYYGNARGSLINNYGNYCNYCGMVVQDSSLAVEHRLPKEYFPSLMLTYNNFFLACPICNSIKNDKPSYAVAKQWAINYDNHPVPNFADIANGGYNRQVWPNRPLAYTGFTPVLYRGLNQVPLANATGLGNRVVNINNNTVQATIPGYNNGATVTVNVQFEAAGNLVPAIQESTFISIVGLNANLPGNYSDRRVTSRTVAWMNALGSLSNLQAFQAGTPLYTAMVNQILNTAQQAGYFSMWAYIFYQKSGPNVANSVYTTFKQQSANAANPRAYFPGTNAANMP